MNPGAIHIVQIPNMSAVPELQKEVWDTPQVGMLLINGNSESRRVHRIPPYLCLPEQQPRGEDKDD